MNPLNIFLINDALGRRDELRVHDDGDHLRLRGVLIRLRHVKHVGIFHNPLAGGQGVALVLYVILDGTPGDHIEFQLRMPVPTDMFLIKLPHDVQIKPDGIVRRAAAIQLHQRVVCLNLCDLQAHPLLFGS